MIKLVADTIDKNDVEGLIEWLSSDPPPRLTKGPVTVEIQNKWSNYIGTNHSVFVNSGSSAILLTLYSLLEMGRLKNKKIVIPSLSWLTDVSSAMQIGLEPILCDCNMQDLSVDLDELEALFISHKPSALLLVSVLGLVPDMNRLVDMCKEHDVLLVEDVAESMGSSYYGKNLGTFGVASIFSTYFGHHISTIEGGFISTDDYELSQVLLSMRNHGWDRDMDEDTREKMRDKWNVDDFQRLYTFYYPGFNLRSTDLQAYIGLSQIDKLDSFKEIRNKNFHTYNSHIKYNMLNIKEKKSCFTSNFAYPVVNKNRDKIIQGLQDEKIEARPLIAGSMGVQPFWVKRYGYSKFENCDIVHKYGFYIPNHQGLSMDDVSKISDIINKHGKGGV
tara:strand:- start:2284 stop:3450 length:1167 start_codon:yes stop_codon:yes gene_type:complete